MEHNYEKLRSMIDSAKSLLTGISINYNSEIGPRTKQLVDISNQIILIINQDYTEIASIIKNAKQYSMRRNRK